MADGTVQTCVTEYLPLVYSNGWKAMENNVWVDYDEENDGDYDTI